MLPSSLSLGSALYYLRSELPNAELSALLSFFLVLVTTPKFQYLIVEMLLERVLSDHFTARESLSTPGRLGMIPATKSISYGGARVSLIR